MKPPLYITNYYFAFICYQDEDSRVGVCLDSESCGRKGGQFSGFCRHSSDVCCISTAFLFLSSQRFLLKKIIILLNHSLD